MSAYSTHPSSNIKPSPNYRWWIPATGIDRAIITSEIQRFLGPDALVRPGPGKGENQGLDGYSISAYRNLTSSMIDDLKRETIRARKEQQAPVPRYTESRHHDTRGTSHIPTPPPPHPVSAYPPPGTGSPYTPDGAYPPPVPAVRGAQPPTSAYQGSQPYGTSAEPTFQEYGDYQTQQGLYTGQQPNVSPNTPQYAHPHYTPVAPAPHPGTAGTYPGFPSPPPTQYPSHAYPSQNNVPRQSQYPPGQYTQAQQQPGGYGYPTSSATSSNQYPGNYQSGGHYQNFQ